MVRPHIQRRVSEEPAIVYFKPRGIPLRDLEEVRLTLDGLEALRLADVEGLYHDAAAERMNVSRPTFGRILEQARRTVAIAIVKGYALRIEGGVVKHIPQMNGGWRRRKGRCRREWNKGKNDEDRHIHR